MQIDLIFTIAILILSIIVHEVSHGYIASLLGDPTARLAGRLTLNPLRHIDPLGSVIIPAFLVLTGSNFLIGWAKPVPYNPYNLKNQRWGEAMVAGAGPGVNLLLAIIFGLIIRFGGSFLSPAFVYLASVAVFINVLLAFFNLIPIPPLDGSKVLKSVLPYRLSLSYHRLEALLLQLGFVGLIGLFLIFFYFLWPTFITVVLWICAFIIGVTPLELAAIL